MKKIIIKIAIIICYVSNTISLFAQYPEQEKKITELMNSYNFSEAFHLANLCLVSDSGNIRLLLLKSQALSELFQYNQAYDVLKKAYILDSANILVLAEISNLCQKKGDTKNAVSFCYKARQLQPKNIYFSLQLAGLYFSSESYRKCLDILIPLYQSDTSNQYAVRTIADCYYEQNMNDSAEYWYEKILISWHYDLYATQKLANIYIRTEKYEKGLKLTEQYIKHDTGLNPVIKLNAYFYHLLNDYKTAVSCFRKCILSGDSSIFVYKKLGLSYYKMEVFDSAEIFFRHAYFIDTTDAETCFYYGVSAARSFLLDTGVLYLNKTLQKVMPPEQFLTNIYIERAEASNQRGEKETALAILEKLHCIYPENKRTFFRIAYQWDYYFRNPALANEYYELFLKDTPYIEAEDKAESEMSYETYARNRLSELKNKGQKQK